MSSPSTTEPPRRTMRVHTSYNVADPPSHPGSAWTRFVCISDTHSRTYEIPPGDVLLHAGDICGVGDAPDLRENIAWISSLPHPVKILIAGNHDLCLDSSWVEGGACYEQYQSSLKKKDREAAIDLVRGEAARRAGIHYLEYESLRFETTSGRTWEVYGSPASPYHYPGSFQYAINTPEAMNIYSKIPSTTEILLTHSPAHGTLDMTRKGKAAGCPTLAASLRTPDLAQCRLHVFGHIHEARGAVVDGARKRVSVNAAVHRLHCVPVIVDLLN